ncbi:hypothetical protein OHB26_18190 [Nocardia sp. NBC_01503]|uniref:nitrilase-related carbon-nitrogen hydrolase n=1 Tax=Nocardia sp. NBC_01503 TaxID=2975997 RepID=UPI002E7C0E86|nr:nitrilase-related carbon-nitrogen hydrolase [Nocardia sp. NBC_01503]WTL35957.1 hypothetical protein OHB26_18190 [Nocardia sp. NBC_01503]
MRQTVYMLGAVVVSGVLWHFGTGLRPVPGLAFLAPLPVLLLVPRVSAGVAFAAGALSWLGGEAQLWSYFRDTLEQPAPFTIALLGGSALVFGALIVLNRALLLRNRPAIAILALPAGWVTLEFVLSLAGNTGAWWSVAYTQAGVLPLMQSVSITGVWGITFLLLLAPSVLAAMVNSTGRQRIRIAIPALAMVAAVAGFGAWRLATPVRGDTVRVGLVAVSQPPDYIPVDSADGRDMISRALTEIEALADRGARAIVLPEKAWRADESTLPQLSGPMTEVATRRGIHIVAGLVLTRAGESINAAIDYPSGVIYAKHYLVPGLEDDLTPGTAYQPVPGEPWSLAICFDLDRPNLVRDNRNLGSRLLLVPALDFTDDHWLHSRMAVIRGIESGIPVARAAQLGELTASDPRGHVSASAGTDLDHTRAVLADLPLASGRTVYARFGDWFAYLAAALFALTIVAAFRRSAARP